MGDFNYLISAGKLTRLGGRGRTDFLSLLLTISFFRDGRRNKGISSLALVLTNTEGLVNGLKVSDILRETGYVMLEFKIPERVKTDSQLHILLMRKVEFNEIR